METFESLKMNQTAGKKNLPAMMIDTDEREEISNVHPNKDMKSNSDVKKKKHPENISNKERGEPNSFAGKAPSQLRKNGKSVFEKDIGNVLPGSKDFGKKINKGGQPREGRGQKGRRHSNEEGATSNKDEPLKKARSKKSIVTEKKRKVRS